MSLSCRLDKDENDKSIGQKLYQGIIRSLLYLTASRPDIIFNICICARFQVNPKESHMLAVKGIWRYLVETQNLGLWYSKQSSINLIGYSDADYGRYKIDRKSTSKIYQFLRLNLIFWFCKKQNSVASSTAKAKYITVGSCCAQIFWIIQQLKDYGIEQTKIPIRCDKLV